MKNLFSLQISKRKNISQLNFVGVDALKGLLGKEKLLIKFFELYFQKAKYNFFFHKSTLNILINTEKYKYHLLIFI